MEIGGWIVLLYVILTALGGWISNRQKRQAQQEARPRPRPEPATHRPLVETAPPPERTQTDAEIAREIRRIMGLEREEDTRVETVEEVYQPPVTSQSTYEYVAEPEYTPPVPVEIVPDSHGGRLHDDLVARGRGPGGLEGQHLRPSLRDRMSNRPLGALAARYAQAQAPLRPAAPALARRSAYLDLSDVARALVTAEVLGPPLALREHLPG